MALILASKSASRRMMLDAAGVAYRCQPADIDERAVEAALGAVPPAKVALALAQAKACAVDVPGDLVLGSDSLVVCNGRRFDKPTSREEAADHLRWFSGQVMELHSAAVLARDGAMIWHHADCARLQVRSLSDGFIAHYLAAEWPEVGHCVGVFRIEGRGVQLFDHIAGSQFTVLGMPLLPLLAALRDLGELAA